MPPLALMPNGTIVAPSWHHRGTIVAPSWHHRGTIVAPSWHHRGTTLHDAVLWAGVSVASASGCGGAIFRWGIKCRASVQPGRHRERGNAAVQGRTSPCFEQVILSDLGAAYNRARRRRSTAHDADDVVQEVYLCATSSSRVPRRPGCACCSASSATPATPGWRRTGALSRRPNSTTKHSPGRPDVDVGPPLSPARTASRCGGRPNRRTTRGHRASRAGRAVNKEMAAVTGAPSGWSCPAWPGHASGCKRDWPAPARGDRRDLRQTRDSLSPTPTASWTLCAPWNRTAPDRLPRLRRRPTACARVPASATGAYYKPPAALAPRLRPRWSGLPSPAPGRRWRRPQRLLLTAACWGPSGR